MTAPEVAIEAKGLSKSFRIGTVKSSTLKETLVRNLGRRGETTTFKALDDVSFTLERGRSLALVGANGSGKSTLLKLVSGLTDADSGTVRVRGHIAALLELGAGFHPDLTGMENVFLQGGILGYSRERIMERLEDIIAFGELGKFIHTPLKRYSSGMRIRLGFALACYSSAEILLIDEVLSVGDAAFQLKCLRKLGQMRDEGRTIIFVSHHLDQVHMVSDDVLWLEKGKVLAHEPADRAMTRIARALVGYDTKPLEVEDVEEGDRSRHIYTASPGGARLVSKGAKIERVRFLDEEGNETEYFDQGRPAVFEVTLSTTGLVPGIDLQIGLSGYAEVSAAYWSTRLSGVELADLDGTYTVRMEVARMPFVPGRFRASVVLACPDRTDWHYDGHVELYTFLVRGRRSMENPQLTVEPPGRFMETKKAPTARAGAS